MLPGTAQDALGQRALADPAALLALLAFAQEHAPALAAVAEVLRAEGPAGTHLTTRIKPLRAILAALRAGIPLSRVPDIAGVRLTGWFGPLDERIARLVLAFPGATVHDTREVVGDRGVHLAVEHARWPVEVQLRTTAQQRWSDADERLHRTGDAAARTAWRAVSARVAELEHLHLAERVLDHTGRRRDAFDLTEADAARCGRPLAKLRAAHQRLQAALAACPRELRRQLFRPPRASEAGPGWFVVVHDRRRSRTLLAQHFTAQAEAWVLCAELSLFYAEDPTVEVVQIGADAAEAARENHGRYFSQEPG